MTAVIIGRTTELEQVRALLAAGAVPAAAVVTGDPGVGKTRLLEQFADESVAPVLRLVGYEPEQLVPLAAATDLLRRLAAVPEHGAAVEELAFRTPSADPVRVFEAAHRACSSLGGPLLLVDDVQWLDELSVALVHYLVRAATSTCEPLRLVAAGRPVARSLGFAEDLRRLLPADRLLTLELAPLDPAESLELARRLDPRLGAEDAALLCERSAGYPFWIEVLVRSGGAPVDAGRLLTARLRDAPQDVGAVLALLAVVGRPVAADDCAELLRWPAKRVETAADDLVSRGIARRRGSELSLTHDLLRAAAAAELPERRRRGLHRRVADWLEAAARDEVALLRQALEHRLEAGEPAVELGIRLVSSPQRRRLGSAGLDALMALADEVDASTAAGWELRRGVAGLACELGEHAVALDRWTRFAPLAPEPALRFEALIEASRAAFELGWEHAGRARTLLAEASAWATTDESVVRVRAHEARIELWLEHDTAAGTALAEEALVASRELAPGRLRLRARLEALHAAQQAAMQRADGGAILALAEEMVVETRNVADGAYAEALTARAVGYSWTRPLATAEASARDALALATQRVLPAQAAEAGLFLAVLLLERAELEEAVRVHTTAVELAVRSGERQPVRLVGHELALLREGPGGALAAYLGAVDALPDPHVRVIPLHIAAQFLSRAVGPGAADEVVALLDRAKADAAAAGCPRCEFELHVAAAASLARVGRTAEAETDLLRAEALRVGHSFDRQLRHAEALAAAASSPARAVATLEQLCEEYRLFDRRLELLWARLDLARVLVPEHPERAIVFLREVATEADARGVQAQLQVARRELRGLGVRTWRRGPTRTGDATLSERERKIAELVGQGASNPEIAHALFLSRKTVERHVSNVLAKVGARNRAELAAFVARQGEGAPR